MALQVFDSSFIFFVYLKSFYYAYDMGHLSLFHMQEVSHDFETTEN